MPRKAYPSNLTDAEWAVVTPLLSTSSRTGSPEAHDRRDLLDAIFYQLRQDGAWRGLPHDFPPWQTVHWWFQRWSATAPGRGWWRRCGSGTGCAGAAIPSRRPPPSTASR